MNYEETLNYLMSRLPMFQRIGAAAFKKDLTNIRLLCDMLDNPQRQFKTIHVAGTNGKGSTSHLLAAILQSAGYKVGLYTSPHYRDFRERVRVQGEMMPSAYVVDFVAGLREHIERVEPSFFEITVAMAFDYFRQTQVDIAVIEVGMGGRFDSTNILETPLLSVITNIDLDHQQFLGDTRDKIAFEKAGIIKPHIPVVIGERHEETDFVFEAKAKECQSELFFAQDMLAATFLRADAALGQAYYNITNYKLVDYQQISLGLLGNYQQRNIQTVLASVAILRNRCGLNISDEALKTGCAEIVKLTNMVGRWQILAQNPLTIADAAHNAHGLRYVVAALADLAYTRLHFVFGMVNDKSAATVLELLPKENTYYYFCKADIPRGRAADDLQQEAANFGLSGAIYPSVSAALQAAQAQATKENQADTTAKSVVYVGGSIFVVAEAL
jgi:dihydrofolate synthase/folylpolyglutamate synthase